MCPSSVSLHSSPHLYRRPRFFLQKGGLLGVTRPLHRRTASGTTLSSAGLPLTSPSTWLAHRVSASRFALAYSGRCYTPTIPRKLPDLWLRHFSLTGSLTPSAAIPDATVLRRSCSTQGVFGFICASRAFFARDILPNRRVTLEVNTKSSSIAGIASMTASACTLNGTSWRILFFVRSGGSVHTSPLISLRFMPTTSPLRWPVSSSSFTTGPAGPLMVLQANQSDLISSSERRRSR